MQSIRRAVKRWRLWELPRWLQLLITAVVAVYCAAIGASAAATRIQAGQLRLFVVLLGCGTAAIELTHSPRQMRCLAG